MPSPRSLAIGFLAAMAIIALLTVIAAAFAPSTHPGSHSHHAPHSDPANNTVATAPTKGGLDPNIDYDDTGSPILENEESRYDTIADAGQEPSSDIEDIIRRTNANLAERGDPMLSEQEECLARAVANGSDRSICNGI